MTSKKCTIDRCRGTHVARGWCAKHYQRWRMTGDPLGSEKSIPNRYESLDKHTGILVITRRDGSECRSIYDLVDHMLVTTYQWHVGASGYVARNLRTGRSGGGGLVHLHRSIMDIARKDPRRVDHRNGNRLDNRRVNLRIAGADVNGENRAVINEFGTSRYRGVCWDKSRGMWKAYTRVHRRMHNLGYFASEEEAAAVIAAYRLQQGIAPGYPERHPETPSKAKH